MYVYIYIYIYTEETMGFREVAQGDLEGQLALVDILGPLAGGRDQLLAQGIYIYIYVYIYIYIYMYTYIYI